MKAEIKENKKELTEAIKENKKELTETMKEDKKDLTEAIKENKKAISAVQGDVKELTSAMHAFMLNSVAITEFQKGKQVATERFIKAWLEGKAAEQ